MKNYYFTPLCAVLLSACSDDTSLDTGGDGELSAMEVKAGLAGESNVRMEPGEWEQTFEVSELELPNMPEEMKGMMGGMARSAFTVRSCLTEEDLASPDADFFSMDGQENCTFEEFERLGNRMNIKMTCDAEEGGKAKISMQGEFEDDAYSLEMENRITGMPIGDMTMKGRVMARRLGDCS